MNVFFIENNDTKKFQYRYIGQILASFQKYTILNQKPYAEHKRLYISTEENMLKTTLLALSLIWLNTKPITNWKPSVKTPFDLMPQNEALESSYVHLPWCLRLLYCWKNASGISAGEDNADTHLNCWEESNLQS